ncbi:hypothetical protein D9756_007424 [Leucocoprinus leucothites]|uniref:Uncharacterized protein n=1 Tax=Leucocoprinus leucothites TaxID=201217 RepID=A0A8H5D159_9AGAR|nr:hypothetical protein D9756_007424 [Leucoagaricus leucothites]
MDTSSATPQPLPRLRVTRAPPSGRRDNTNASVASSQAGPSRLTDFTQLVDLNLSDIRAAHAYTDEDEDEDQYPTPRMNNAAPLAPSSATPTPNLAGRLRELIHLVPNGSTSQATPTPHRPHSPTFHESDFEGDSAATGHSRARESLRDIFSKALRDPGDTPQKSRQRRNSDSSASESDVLPATSRKLPDIKGKRKSSSDEESVDPLHPTNHDSRQSTSQQHTVLRSSRETSAVDFPLRSISAEDSDDVDELPPPRRHNTHTGPSTTLHSLRLSQSSNFPQHSNLLDQDSEMQRAFGDVESSDDPSVYPHKPHEPRTREAVISNPSSTMPAPKKTTTPQTTRHARKSLDSNGSYENQSTSTAKPTPRQPDRRTDNREKDPRSRRTSLQGSAPSELRRKSSASLQFSDHSSAMSVSDYGERVKEVEQERNREREREWNKPHPKNTRPGSSLSFNSPRPQHRSRTSSISSLESPRPGSALSNMSIDSEDSPRVRARTSSGLSDRSRTFSGGSRPGSALSNDSMSIADFPQNLRRHHSLTNRPQSPASSLGAENQLEEVEVEHERERNWNAPRPKWHRRSLPNTPDRPASPGPTKLSTTPQSPMDRRRFSTTPSTALKDNSNTSRSGSSLVRRHSQPKAPPHSPSPLERRNAVSPSIAKSPHSRLSTVSSSSPVGSRSPGQISHQKSRLPVPSASSHRSREEFPRAAPDIRVQDESGEPQMPSPMSFPQTNNNQSQVHDSMELTEAYNGHELSSAIPSFSDASEPIPTPNDDTMHTASLDPQDSQGIMYQIYVENEANSLAQERTPKLQTIDPPTDDSQGHAFETSLPIDQDSADISPRENSKFESVSPDFQPSDANQSSSVPSFLSTPPRSRQSSFNSSKQEFQTPSPPKGGLPDLPEPPSGNETEDEALPQFNITPVHIDTTPVNGAIGRGDVTTFKTPKPPGAWFATPGPSTILPPGREDLTQGYVDSSDDGLLKAKSHSQSIFPQTPAAPGGWASTPAAVRQRTHSDPQSLRNNSGLMTPAVSLGRANTLPPKTPAPPGGWINTPGVTASSRKSVLKVRFDPDVTSPANGSSDISSGSLVYPTNGSSALGRERSTTPEPIAPSTPPSRSPRKHKRSPSVRMVDAYGNEQKQDAHKRETSSPTPSTPRSRSGIRIVDALGQEVTEEIEEHTKALHEEDTREDTPMTRMEALQRVRQGIQELADGIESLDWPSRSRDDAARIRELDETSRALKQSREQIAHDMHKVEKRLRRQVWQRVRISSFLGRNGWFLLFVALIQIALIFIMYRASVLRARKLFLTNYYDPFNPDLFLYTTNPDTQYATPTISWSLVTQSVRSGDLRAFTGAFRDNLSILLKRWHQQIWDVWGDDPTRPVGVWPPT